MQILHLTLYNNCGCVHSAMEGRCQPTILYRLKLEIKYLAWNLLKANIQW